MLGDDVICVSAAELVGRNLATEVRKDVGLSVARLMCMHELI